MFDFFAGDVAVSHHYTAPCFLDCEASRFVVTEKHLLLEGTLKKELSDLFGRTLLDLTLKLFFGDRWD